SVKRSASPLLGSTEKCSCPCQPPRVTQMPRTLFSDGDHSNSSRSPVTGLSMAAKPSATGAAKILAHFPAIGAEEISSNHVAPLNKARVDDGSSSQSPGCNFSNG